MSPVIFSSTALDPLQRQLWYVITLIQFCLISKIQHCTYAAQTMTSNAKGNSFSFSLYSFRQYALLQLYYC